MSTNQPLNIDFETPEGIVLEIEYRLRKQDEPEILFLEALSPCGRLLEDDTADELFVKYGDDILWEMNYVG